MVDNKQLHVLPVYTRHPEDYVLINELDGTRWRGSSTGWKPEPVPTLDIKPGELE